MDTDFQADDDAALLSDLLATASTTDFDYHDIGEDIRDFVRDSAALVRGHKEIAKEAIIEIGRRLIEVKRLLPHGSWLPWLHAECACKERSAQRYMEAARARDAKNDSVSDSKSDAASTHAEAQIETCNEPDSGEDALRLDAARTHVVNAIRSRSESLACEAHEDAPILMDPQELAKEQRKKARIAARLITKILPDDEVERFAILLADLPAEMIGLALLKALKAKPKKAPESRAANAA